MTSTCENCVINSKSFFKLLNAPDSLLVFMERHGVVCTKRKCPKCSAVLTLTEKDNIQVFRCRRVIRTKKGKQICNVQLSLFEGTFFSNVKIPMSAVCEVVFHYLTRPPPRMIHIMRETNLSSRTIIDYFSFIREVFVYWATINSQKIGGPGKVVEIDEAKIGKRKNNRGRPLEGQWVFGGIERGSKNCFLIAVENRSSDVLTKIIEEKIEHGTTIISDCWRAYDSLNDEHYHHLTVNHSMNFVDPVTRAHTQNIERLWVEVRKLVPHYGRKKSHYPSYLCECLFMMRHRDHRKRFHHFWKLAGELYPPKND